MAPKGFTNENTPLFNWDASTGNVQDYLLQVNIGDINTGQLVIAEVIAGNPTPTQFQRIAPLPDDGYQWRVRARDQALNSTSSATGDFFVDTVQPTTPGALTPVGAGPFAHAEVFTWNRSTDPGFPNAGSGVNFYNVVIRGSAIPEGPRVIQANDSAIVCPSDLCQFNVGDLTLPTGDLPSGPTS